MDFLSTARLGAENFLFEQVGYEEEANIISIAPLFEGRGSEFVVEATLGNRPLRLVVRVIQQATKPYILLTTEGLTRQGVYWVSPLKDLKEVR